MCDSIWSHYNHLEQSLRMRRVTWPITGGQKLSSFLKSLTPLCHFQGATTKIKLCYMRKIAFIPLWRLQSSRRMRSITWPVHRGTPKTTRNNFLTPTYLLTIQLYGATVTIKVRPSLYWSISMLKRFSAAKKVQSKSVHKMAVFRKFKGLHINCGHQAPQKAHPWPERRILAYFS